MRSLLGDAFGHHVWATMRVFEVCEGLTDEQLASSVPGTYGSILDTLRHVVGADASYLFVLTRGRRPRIDEETMSVADLRAEMETDAAAWEELRSKDIDPDEELERVHEDGSRTRATWGVRLAQALHHGTDHRSQLCTAFTALGIEPPAIDVWDYGETVGRVSELPPTS